MEEKVQEMEGGREGGKEKGREGGREGSWEVDGRKSAGDGGKGIGG